MSFDPNSDQKFDFLANMDQPIPEVPDEVFSADKLMELESSEINGAFLADEDQNPLMVGAFEQGGGEDYQIPAKTYHGKFSADQDESPDEPAAEEPVPDEMKRTEENVPQKEAASEEQIPELPSFLNANEEKEEKEQSPLPKKKTRAVKKGRPRRKKGEGLFGIPNILVTLVWCGLTLMISLTLGRLAWICAAEVLAFGREDKNVSIVVYENDSIDDITKKLAREGLIHYPGLFKLYAQFAVDDGDIHPGMWDLNTKYDYHALVKMMSPSSSREVIKVMIPEGYTCRQIFALLEDNKVCTAKDIETYAAYGQLDAYWFLEGITRGDKYCLEGFLFPDTYEFYKNDTPKNVLSRMLNNFGNRFDEELQWKIQTLNTHLTDLMRRSGHDQAYINANQFTVRDVVNVAAMIEKETSSVQEGYTIASVIYNRLFSWGNNPPYLNIDATIVYALNGKNDLTYEDLRVDSPYNTYTNMGLPIGPIANPGLASLKAALDPSDTNYYFYVLDPSVGSHHFSTTQAEHDAFRASLGG